MIIKKNYKERNWMAGYSSVMYSFLLVIVADDHKLSPSEQKGFGNVWLFQSWKLSLQSWNVPAKILIKTYQCSNMKECSSQDEQ